MASPITVGGLQALIADQGDTFAWGSPVKALLAQIAATCLQTTGGSFPLTADLNLGTSFGLLAPYFKSSNGANIAASGVLRLLNTELVAWRNVGASADNVLGIGQGAGQATDELVYKNATAAVAHMLTGNPFAEYNTTAGQSIPNAVQTTINYGTKVTDTDNAVTPGASWVFTVPSNKAGIYFISANCTFTTMGATGAIGNLLLLKNGLTTDASQTPSFITASSTNPAIQLTTLVTCAAADTLAISVFQGSGGAVALYAGSTAYNRVVICRLPVGGF